MLQAQVIWDDLSQAALCGQLPHEATHRLYRYPGSMSPFLARALVLAFTKPGDMILDPFCGGGTTAVEAITQGRDILCTDLNALACFITQAKARPLGSRSVREIERWSEVANVLLSSPPTNLRAPLVVQCGRRYAPRTHGILLALRDSVQDIPIRPAREFAQLIVLRVGQLCFHCRNAGPTPRVLARTFQRVSSQALTAIRIYSEPFRLLNGAHGPQPKLKVLQVDALKLREKLGRRSAPIAMILTSPPYPGIHVLYHRWQILGRRETSLPFKLAGIEDGRYESEYALGSRQQSGTPSYFARLKEIYANLRPVLTRHTTVAQVIGFANPDLQIGQFREAMNEAGYNEVMPPGDASSAISRTVPRRRWYAVISPRQHSAREYVFIHRPRGDG